MLKGPLPHHLQFLQRSALHKHLTHSLPVLSSPTHYHFFPHPPTPTPLTTRTPRALASARAFFFFRQRNKGLKTCRSIDTLYQQAACLRPILQRKIEKFVGETPNASRIGGCFQVILVGLLKLRSIV